MLTYDDVLKMPEKEANEYFEKMHKVLDLYICSSDYLVYRFFNTDSYDMLDDKIEVLEALEAGKKRKDIPKYYDILENYPREDVEYTDEYGRVVKKRVYWD